MFFTFTQNNSGGSFDHDEDAGIGYAVVVEADSANEANDKAERIGIYFNGCEDERDCECCGDRWSAVWENEGDEEPLLYGKPVMGQWGIPSYVHYADGHVERCEP